MAVIELNGAPVAYRLVRSSRTRRITIRVTAEGVRVTAPTRVSVAGVERALRADRDWITAALARAAAAAPPPLGDGAVLPYLDESLLLALADVRAVRRDGARLLVPAGADPVVAVERWYRSRARDHLGSLVATWAPVMGVSPGGLAVRGQRSRWGSASARGTIALNWRLMLAPARIGEYVVVHELAHLLHMDHSPRFWAAVERHWPDHRADRAWLRSNGPSVLAMVRGPAAGSVVSAG